MHNAQQPTLLSAYAALCSYRACAVSFNQALHTTAFGRARMPVRWAGRAAPDPLVADWCAQPIEIGVPGFVLRPPVLRRNSIPVVTDPAEAVHRPELGVLSAMAHGETEQGATIAGAVLPAIQGLDDERARLYYDLVYNSLNEAARRALEAIMKGYEYQSDFAKKYVAQGRDEGRVEGRVEEAARALLTVLRARGIALPDAARERILAQKDPERLERWIEKAATAATFTEVLDEPS